MTGRRDALIVASYDHEDARIRGLRAPAHDANALGEVLGDERIGGFTVRTLLNEPAHVINEAIEEFFADRASDDLLLVHFSGHGVKDESGELYLAARNTKLHRLSATAVASQFVSRQMTRSRSRRIVLMLDCCYAGAFARGLTPRATAAVDIGKHLGGRGRAVLTSSSAMEYAFEGGVLADVVAPTRPSVFTGALVEGLATGAADRNGDGLVTLDELYEYVYDRVREITPNQTPGKWTFDMQGDLCIAYRSEAPAPLRERPPDPPTPGGRLRAGWRWLRGSRRRAGLAAAVVALALLAGIVLDLGSRWNRNSPTGAVAGRMTESAPPATGPIIFQDDFSARSSGWPDNAGTTHYGGYYLAGAYRFWVKPKAETWWANPAQATTVHPVAPSKIRIDVRARWSDGGAAAWYGIACRTTRDTDGYVLAIAEGAAQIQKFRDGVYQDLTTQPVRGVDPNADNRLQADCTTEDKGVHLILRVNGVTVAETTDRSGPLAEGSVGVAVSNGNDGGAAEAQFDDFVVRRL